MEFRALLEGRATALACGRIDAAGFRRLHKYSLDLDAASQRVDIVAYLDVNQKLKFTIYGYCNSPSLYTLIEILWLKAGPALRYHSQVLREITKINFHRQAIKSLERGNSVAAARSISRDIEAGMRTLLKVGQFRSDGVGERITLRTITNRQVISAPTLTRTRADDQQFFCGRSVR